MQKLTRRDWTFLAICAAIFGISLAGAMVNFWRAFPEASIEFRYDRGSSRPIAEQVLRRERIDAAQLRHTAVFDVDDPAKIFLERSLGLDKASGIMRRDVHIWFWRHRWFKPLQEEEYAVEVAPTGELVSFAHRIPEKRAIPTPDVGAARATAEGFLARNGIPLSSLHLVAQSERNLPHRVQRIFSWESNTIRPAGAPYRHVVSVDGNVVTDYSQRLRVPDEWQRTYRELRSKNLLAGKVDTVFLVITMIATVAVFIVRLRRGDMRLRFLAGIALLSVVLTAGVSINAFPSALADYDTTTSYDAWLAQFGFATLLQAAGTAMLLVVVCGAGEVLYRQRLPQHLAMSRIWTPRALGSKRVFFSFVVAYTLVAFFLAYQVFFYLIAQRFGAWSPADIPYDDTLNSALPWVAVLFAGFFPALSEEFLSRAFSIPFFDRVLRSRIAAIVVAGFIWGFGHATYPNQPFFIRGLEVGLAGVLLGFLFDAFGLLPLLIWHYTVDAFYTAMLLFRSHNAYYIGSATVAAFLFAIPMLLSIALYLRRGGFEPDDDLTNATLPVSAPPPPKEEAAVEELAPARPVPPALVIALLVTIAAAAILAVIHPSSPGSVVDYRITKEAAKAIAAAHKARMGMRDSYSRVISTTVEGFRSWSRRSPREEGGAPGSFDTVAAEYLLRHGLTMEKLVEVFRTKIQAATWTVRFFTPMKSEELFVEVDPRTSRAIGHHKYQAEGNPGARLEQAEAMATAMPQFRAYGIDPAAFELKEALSFQQPRRRDWLFHFQEKRPIAGDAFRRVTIRVAGREVTQFNVTVKVPDEVYREADQQTLRNVVLMILKIAGGMAAFTLLVAGFVVAAVNRRPRWGRALRWTLYLAIIPIVTVAAGYEDSLFGYNTSVRWDTFYAGLAIDLLRSVAVRLGVLFLALAAIDSAFPAGFALLRREGRARFGRSAVVAAFTAIAAVAVIRGAVQLVSDNLPAAATVSLDISELVAVPFPAAVAIGNSILAAVIGSGVVACFAAAFSAMRKRPWVPDALMIAVIFCSALDPSVPAAGMALMLFRAAVMAGTVWALIRYVLGGNVFAWPVAIFTATMLDAAATLFRNDRVDLYVNGAIVVALFAAAILSLIKPREQPQHA